MDKPKQVSRLIYPSLNITPSSPSSPITNSESKLKKPFPKIRNLAPMARCTPPRFQKYAGSPQRFQLINNTLSKKNTKAKRSLTNSPCDKSLELDRASPLQSFTPNFTPKMNSYLFLSEPPTIYDLEAKDLQKVKGDFNTIVSVNQKKDQIIVNGIKNIKKECKALTNLIITQSKCEREELQEVSIQQSSIHSKQVEFFKEVKNNNAFAVQTMLIMNPELIKEVDSTMQTALHWAVKRNYIQLVKSLLNFGANPRSKDFAGRTPEKIARKNEFKHILKLLTSERRSALDYSKQIDGPVNKQIEKYKALVGLHSRNATRKRVQFEQI